MTQRGLFADEEEAIPLPFVVDVALDHPALSRLSYASDVALQKGVRVIVPLNNESVVAIVFGCRPWQAGERSLKTIGRVLDSSPAFPEELLRFLEELARYYLCPLGEAVKLALPGLRPSEIGQASFGKLAATVPQLDQVWIGQGNLPSEGMKISGRARELLELVAARGAQPLAELSKQFSRGMIVRLVEQGLLNKSVRRAVRTGFDRPAECDVVKVLNEGQRAAVSALEDSISSRANKGFLLFGVTGSGKTEVYLAALEATLQEGRGAIVLVPEIALTPQLLARYRARFGDEVAVVHSGLDRGRRRAMWEGLSSGKLRVAIGARSALFSPVADLGLIVVDEEHEPSFKQEDGLRYQARDAALLRAKGANATCVLGSATPSLEAFFLAHEGKLSLLSLPDRAAFGASLPEVRLIDLKHVGPGPSRSPLLSLPLHRAIEATLARGEQSILFLNRRGFSPALICTSCGEIERCERCSVSLTLHVHSGRRIERGQSIEVPPGLRCHYCDGSAPSRKQCSRCGGLLLTEGAGTEKLVELLKAAFPSARVDRLDRDIGSGKAIEAVLDGMRAGEIDILVGTQMVAKGHDLPNVTLVGVVNVDGALGMPDFRAAERTFQLLVQVAGRAGRADKRGLVLVQTRKPEHPAIAGALAHDVRAFVEQEMIARRELGYPPFSRAVLVRVESASEQRACAAAEALAVTARDAAAGTELMISGPAAAPLAKVREKYRFRLLLRGERRAVHAVARAVQAEARTLSRDVKVIVDIDPYAML